MYYEVKEQVGPGVEVGMRVSVVSSPSRRIVSVFLPNSEALQSLIRRRPLLRIVKYADNLQLIRADLSVDDNEGCTFNYEFTGTVNSIYSARPWMDRQYVFYCLDDSKYDVDRNYRAISLEIYSSILLRSCVAGSVHCSCTLGLPLGLHVSMFV